VSKVLMIGLDGITFSVLTPAFEAGVMPKLRRLLNEGVSGVLTSTVPPFTPPGWTSIFTGVNPGKHGVFGFTLGNAQRKGGLVRLDRVAAPAIWNAANAQGVEVGLFNVPMTYPPPPVHGWAVSGMMTPEGGGNVPPTFTHPADLLSPIFEGANGYQIDVDVDYEKDWRSTAIIDRLSQNLATKRRTLTHLLEKRGHVGIMFAVLEAPDRLMHVHYKYLDPRYEHFSSPEAEAIRDRAWRFFDEMDGVVGDLLQWAGPDSFAITMSDHGFQGKDKSVNVNLALMEWGLLNVAGLGKLSARGSLRRIATAAKTVIPKRVYRRAKSMAHVIDWTKTKAFSAPNPQQGIYINLEGREPHGIVPASEYEAVRDEVIERFKSWIDPDDGMPVLDAIHPREEVMEGPEAEGAPDLFPICRQYAYELNDGLYADSALTDFRDLPRGIHHLDGVFGIAGPGVKASTNNRASVCDIAPTVLYLAGVDVPPTDGRVLTEHIAPELLETRPVKVVDKTLPRAGQGIETSPYTPEDEARIEESLRNLGYL
jgi:predicted AlkP superfamily phosphohydrolase/phosphomutase